VVDLVADIQACFDRGYTDGLPVVPPYAELVDDMLAALGWRASEVLATDGALRLEFRAEQVASIAVMAGCETAYARVLRPLTELRAASTGCEASTWRSHARRWRTRISCRSSRPAAAPGSSPPSSRAGSPT
jgi:hypothetical protein